MERRAEAVGHDDYRIEIALAQDLDEPSRPVTVYLWTDPTNDGDPSDAVVARSIPTVTTHEITFETFPIAPLTLPAGSWFYAGAIYVADEEPVLKPAPLDATPPFFAGRSFTISWGAAVPDPNNLVAGDIFAETAGNYLIRVFAVPEPASIIPLGVASLALGSRVRQRLRAAGRTIPATSTSGYEAASRLASLSICPRRACHNA